MGFPNKSLADRRAQEHANKLRCAVQQMRQERHALMELGYTVEIGDGKVIVKRVHEEQL